jgi:hypothetical protein
MNNGKRRLVETFSGKGWVFINKSILAEAIYRIEVHQNIKTIRRDDFPGRKYYSGDLIIVDEVEDLTAKFGLTLKLDDGRFWDFKVTGGNKYLYKVEGSGRRGFYRVVTT